MRVSTRASAPAFPLALAASILVAACGESDPSAPARTATLSGVVSAASWLPTQKTALSWQRMAGGTVVVSAC